MARQRARHQRAAFRRDAFLVLDKPEGPTSYRVVERVKRLLGAAKAGHTGTLDPFASGVLPIGLNQATKAVRFFLSGRKTYEAAMVLGVETDTQDRTGKVLARWSGPLPDEEEVRRSGSRLVGTVAQTPPLYSAVKVQGVRLYKLARQGKRVEPPAREVEIYELQVTGFDPPEVRFRVSCSGGTYVRTLASQWGCLLGCGAHLHSLRRIRCGVFGLDEAVTLEQLEEAVQQGEVEKHLIGLNRALAPIPCVRVSLPLARRIRQGWQPTVSHLEEEPDERLQKADVWRVVSGEDDLVAILSPVPDEKNKRIERLRIVRVFNP